MLHAQNALVCPLSHSQPALKISWKSASPFFRNVANRHGFPRKIRKKSCMERVTRNIPKMLQNVPCTKSHLSWKFHRNPFIRFAAKDRQRDRQTDVHVHTGRQTDRLTVKRENITFIMVEVTENKCIFQTWRNTFAENFINRFINISKPHILVQL